MERSLAGKIAVVTGASSGIGKAISQKLALMGCRLVLAGRDETRLSDLAAELGEGAIWVSSDLAHANQIDDLVDRSLKEFGRIDIVVANAGIFNNLPVAESDPSEITQMVNINLTSVMLLTQAVLAQMSQQQSGEILMIGSIAGVADMRNEAVYSGTKHGVNAYARSLRRQVAKDGIRVGSILPGTVATELWGEIDAAKVDAQVAAGEVLRPGDIAKIAAFMLQQPANVALREIVVLPHAQDI